LTKARNNIACVICFKEAVKYHHHKAEFFSNTSYHRTTTITQRVTQYTIKVTIRVRNPCYLKRYMSHTSPDENTHFAVRIDQVHNTVSVWQQRFSLFVFKTELKTKMKSISQKEQFDRADATTRWPAIAQDSNRDFIQTYERVQVIRTRTWHSVKSNHNAINTLPNGNGRSTKNRR